VVRTLPEGEPVWGVTSLADEVYVLREKKRDQVEVYDARDDTYHLLRRLTVPNCDYYTDMTSCPHKRCVYVANENDHCVYGLNVEGAGTWWCVNDEPAGLSVNAGHNVLIICEEVRKIKEFSSRGELLRELTLPGDVINPLHAIQLKSGQFIVCHGDVGDAVPHRVCKISEDGNHVVQSHGGQRGSAHGQYDKPARLAVDDNEFVFVVDYYNRRVTLLSPTLTYMREVVFIDDMNWIPVRLHLNTQIRRLYVAVNKWNPERDVYTAGRVEVFSV